MDYYIKKDDAINAIFNALAACTDMSEESMKKTAHKTIDCIDCSVVEIVKCKDCKHNPHNTIDDICPFVDSDGYVKEFPYDDEFCSRGERKEDN